MASVRSESDSMNSDYDEDGDYLDPRIQIELERLNTCTDEINKLETELDEANTTFRMLLNESMRRLKVLTCRLGSCIDRARPYYEAVDIAKKAQAECQRAAVKFQRANEIHQAAKETVALAETRFLSNQHEWQFDSAWQEMLNHAIIKVTEAEHQRTESGQEHQKRATLFNVAEQRVAMLEQKLKRTIIKSRPYFEEKVLCQEQLDTQKKRVEELQGMITKVKSDYSGSLKRLEAISEEIHQRRRNKSGSASPLPRGPREPGVGAELDPKLHEEIKPPEKPNNTYSPDLKKSESGGKWPREDLDCELERFEVCSFGSMSVHTSSHVSESEDFDDEDLDELRQKVKELSMTEVRSDTWETELAESILRLDNAMLERECNSELRAIASKPCGSPLREQDCNRELTAIVTNRSEENLLASIDNKREMRNITKSLPSLLTVDELKFGIPSVSNQIQQLSALALNQMVVEKEAKSCHSTPTRSLSSSSRINSFEISPHSIQNKNQFDHTKNVVNPFRQIAGAEDPNQHKYVSNSSQVNKSNFNSSTQSNTNLITGTSTFKPSNISKIEIEKNSKVVTENVPQSSQSVKDVTENILNLSRAINDESENTAISLQCDKYESESYHNNNLQIVTFKDDRSDSLQGGKDASENSLGLLNTFKDVSENVPNILNTIKDASENVPNILHSIKDASENVLNRLVRQDSNPFKLIRRESSDGAACNVPFKDPDCSTIKLNNTEKQTIVQSQHTVDSTVATAQCNLPISAVQSLVVSMTPVNKQSSDISNGK